MRCRRWGEGEGAGGGGGETLAGTIDACGEARVGGGERRQQPAGDAHKQRNELHAATQRKKARKEKEKPA